MISLDIELINARRMAACVANLSDYRFIGSILRVKSKGLSMVDEVRNTQLRPWVTLLNFTLSDGLTLWLTL